MAENSFPWSVVTAGDRTVSADTLRRAIAGLGFTGVFGGLLVTRNADASSVDIDVGTAVIDGVVYVVGPEPFNLAVPAGARKDYVVLRYTAADRVISAAILQGNAVAFPALTKTAAVYEIAIATVDNSSGGFVVTDTRDRSGLSQMWQPSPHAVGAANEPTFENGWANFGSGYRSAGYWKDRAGVVHLTGIVSSGTVNTAIFTLPAGFRPSEIEIFDCLASGGNAMGRLDVNPDGRVVLAVGAAPAFASLCGISFFTG